MSFDIDEYINSLPDDTEVININGKGVTYIPDLSRFTKLTDLHCKINSLTELPQLNDTLETLNCTHNQLIRLPALPNSLKTLLCDYNSLEELPELNDNLEILSCMANALTFLPSLSQKLELIYCGNNLLRSLPEFNVNLKVFGCSNQNDVGGRSYNNDINYNVIRSLPEFNENMEYLTVNNIGLTSLPKLNAKLFYIYCERNQLERLPILNEKLKILSCCGNNIRQLPDLNKDMDVFCKSNPLDVYFFRQYNHIDTIILVNTINRFRFVYYSTKYGDKFFYKFVKRRLNVYRDELLETQARLMYSPSRIERLFTTGEIKLDDLEFDEDF